MDGRSENVYLQYLGLNEQMNDAVDNDDDDEENNGNGNRKHSKSNGNNDVGKRML